MAAVSSSVGAACAVAEPIFESMGAVLPESIVDENFQLIASLVGIQWGDERACIAQLLASLGVREEMHGYHGREVRVLASLTLGMLLTRGSNR